MHFKVISSNMELAIVSPTLTHLRKMGVQKENIDTSKRQPFLSLKQHPCQQNSGMKRYAPLPILLIG